MDEGACVHSHVSGYKDTQTRIQATYSQSQTDERVCRVNGHSVLEGTHIEVTDPAISAMQLKALRLAPHQN